MSLRANTIHCMRISAGLLSRVAAVTVAISSIATGCAFGRTPATPHISVDSDHPYRLIQEPDAGYQPIIDLIRSSTRSVRMTMYELADDAAVAALTDAHRRGVDVMAVLDTAFAGHDTNRAAYDALHAAGVQVKWAPNDVIYHQKTITVDDTIAAVGTGNLTKKSYPTSRDAYILDTNPNDVAAIAATFDTDFTAPPGGHPPAATAADRLIWSPGARQTFLQRIDAATHTLDITSEELKDRAVLAAIDKAARRGVACRIVLTDNPAWSTAINEVSASGCSVHLLPATASALYMHEKIVLVDSTTLIIGSQNLSTASLLENRELSLQLDTSTAPDVIAAVRATFDSDYHQAIPPPARHASHPPKGNPTCQRDCPPVSASSMFTTPNAGTSPGSRSTAGSSTPTARMSPCPNNTVRAKPSPTWPPCSRAAYKMINTPITRSADAQPRIRAVLPAPIVGELIHVLRAAQAIADERWHRSTFDIYRCTRLAWQNAGMMLPHTLLITTLRAALPPATTLADYNHAARTRTIHALFDDAINIWRRRLAPQCTANSARIRVA